MVQKNQFDDNPGLLVLDQPVMCATVSDAE